MIEISTDIIGDVVQVLEELLDENDLELTPSRKSELVVLLCQEIKEQEEDSRKANNRAYLNAAIKRLLTKG